MSDPSPSPSPSASSSGSSSMFPSANVPTSPPPNAVLSGTTAMPPTASSVTATALNNMSTPPDSQAQPQLPPQTQTQNQNQAPDSALPSHLRTTNPTTGSIDSAISVPEDTPMADAPSSSIPPTAIASTAGLKRERPTSKGGPSSRENAFGSLLAPTDEDENAPGYAWRNKRAVEEMQKAREGVLDRDFSLKEFGDPFLEQVQAEKLAGK